MGCFFTRIYDFQPTGLALTKALQLGSSVVMQLAGIKQLNFYRAGPDVDRVRSRGPEKQINPVVTTFQSSLEVMSETLKQIGRCAL